MKREILMTREGMEKLKEELDELTKVRRPEIISRIKSAKELGDLSENAEYTSAKEDQSFVEGRIQEIEETIKHAKIVENTAKGSVSIGSQLTVKVEGEQESIEVVGATESDPNKGKISIDSPVGQALLGHKVNDVVSVQTPDGAIDYKIITIS